MSDFDINKLIGDLKGFDDGVNDNQLKLPSGDIITFNDQQYEGVNKIRSWLPTNKKFFTLSGYAGTGKSTIIKKIIDEFGGNLVVSAPTHKAKKVVMKTTGQPGETLHKLLGLRPDLDLDNFNPNNPEFNQIALASIGDYHLVIIDEASMINLDLFEMIKNEVMHFTTKVLFMGDIAQIPPIGEKISAVFVNEVGEFHQLTQVMRQKDGNPIFPIYDNLRNNLDKFNGGIVRKTAVNENGEGIYFLRKKGEFRDRLIKIFDTVDFRNSFDFAKLIAWRNTTVMESNQIIRELIYGKEVRFLEIGDVLMAYRSIRNARQFANIIDNSTDYRIDAVSKRYQNEFDLWGYKATLSEELPDGTVMRKSLFIVDNTDHDNIHNYAEIHDGLKMMAKSDKSLWKKYYAFRRESIIMMTIKHYRDGSTRPNEEVIAKDMDYGYAITAHKSQGSTYSHVFVLEDDMSLNQKIKEMNQIKYVSFTRPTTTATVLTTLS